MLRNADGCLPVQFTYVEQVAAFQISPLAGINISARDKRFRPGYRRLAAPLRLVWRPARLIILIRISGCDCYLAAASFGRTFDSPTHGRGRPPAGLAKWITFMAITTNTKGRIKAINRGRFLEAVQPDAANERDIICSYTRNYSNWNSLLLA